MTILVGKSAPDFTAKAVLGNNSIKEDFNLSEYIKSKYAVVFFYPLDFTFVCPTEIIAFEQKLAEFEKRGVAVIAISVDSVYSHLNWKNTPREKGGIGQVRFPMIADLTKDISRKYGVLFGESISLRATFIIDAKGIIRHQSVNDVQIGRSVDEVLRLTDALQHADQYGNVCPANWAEGDAGLKANSEAVAEYLKNQV